MIKGSLVALVTPMDADGAIQWDALDRLVDWHIAEGTDGIVAVGTTGESATLDLDEHIAVIKRVVDRACGRIPVIAGTGANSTAEAIELTEKSAAIGADAALIVTPYYNKPPQEACSATTKRLPKRLTCRSLLTTCPAAPGSTCCRPPSPVWRRCRISSVLKRPRATWLGFANCWRWVWTPPSPCIRG